MEPRRIIHIRIRDLRRERELTQEELAEALGISRQSINAMEAGRALPSLPVALQIASFFAVPLNQLIAIQEANQRRQQLLEQSMPAVNVAATDTHVQLSLALPGFQKEDVTIDVDERAVTVAGQSSAHEDDYFHQEFSSQSFSRTIPLPVPVRPDASEAAMRNGILTIILERQDRPTTKRLEIRG